MGNQVLVRQGCMISQSRVDDGALIGPYAHLRPESEIGEGAHVGNFVETKKVRLGKGSKANHLTYLGDAEIGEGVNVGAGAITCNYDGVAKRKTIIGDNVFVGSDSPWWHRSGWAMGPISRPDRASRRMCRRMRWHWGGRGRRPRKAGRAAEE